VNIVDEIKKELLNRVSQNKDELGYDIWEVHIKDVVRIANELAEKYNADREIVELAALLHDVARASLEGPNDEHHIYGAEIAEELLASYEYPKDRIERVKQCVFNHPSGLDLPRNTIEEECIADADALSHFDDIPGMFYLAYTLRGLNESEGRKFVREKLEGDYLKLSERTRTDFEEKYKNIMSVIFVNIEED